MTATITSDATRECTADHKAELSAGSINADEESGKADSGEGGHGNARVAAGRAVWAGDQPDTDAGEHESGDGECSRQSLRDHGECGWDGSSENSRHWGGDSHISS